MNRRLIISLVLVVFLAGVAFWGCRQGPQASADFYNIRKINLRMVDKTHMLDLARAALEGKSLPKDKDRYPIVYNDEPRGVFLTLVRPNQPALTAFGFADSIFDAIRQAAPILQSLAEREDIDKLKLRVDVLDESTDQKQRTLSKKWSIDISRYGLIFETNPVAAFMPHELRDWGIITKKNKYSYVSMKKLIRHRKLGRVLYDQLAEEARPFYARFTVISFMEQDGSDEPLLLYRNNRLDGFEPTPERLYEAIDAAGHYLTDAVKDDGTFKYLYFPHYHKYSKSYNQLRHGGTVFSMVQIYEVTKDPELLEAIKRALGYLQRVSEPPDENDRKTYDWLAVTHEKRRYSKLGGSGLALLAFGKYTEVTGDTQYMDLMRAYGRFIEYMQYENGDVRMRYYHRAQDKNKKTEPVLYYPGEAFYGLAQLYKLDNQNPRWLKVAEKGLDYIADVRDVHKTSNNVPHDHWLMYAINEWYRVKPKENHLRHANKVVDAMMSRFIFKSKQPDYVGGYYSRPQTTPAACRLEGTAAMYKLAQFLNDKKQQERLYRACALGATFLMRNQYNTINTMFFKNPDQALGGYQASYWNPEIQIDFVQHSTSAVIATREMIMEKQKQEQGEQEEAPADQEEAA